MNNEDVNDRKQKLNDIIKKITDSQLSKIQGAKPERDYGINPNAKESDLNKAMTIKELSSFATPLGKYKTEEPGSSSDMPPPKPAGAGITL